eukprot:PhM_4_TR3029/c0_g1_i1/m.41387
MYPPAPFMSPNYARQRMQEHIKRVQQVHDSAWIVRGMVPFPQGIKALFHLSKGWTIPQVPDMPYFSDNPAHHVGVLREQPEPQQQLTEEIQNMWRVMKGVEVKVSDIDTTGTILASNTGDLLVYNPVPLSEQVLDHLNAAFTKKSLGVSGSERLREIRSLVYPSAQASIKGLKDWAELLCPEADVYACDEALPLVRAALPSKQNIYGLSERPEFTAGNNLVKIRGDPRHSEWVLYHEASQMLNTMHLYYGPYTDMDPCCTWLARAWFKFTRDGDYKSRTVLPSYRRNAILKEGDINELRACLRNDVLDRFSDMKMVTHCNGTPPLATEPEQYLWEMWSGEASWGEHALKMDREANEAVTTTEDPEWVDRS